MGRGFISPQGASNLSTYQYNGVDQSIIANLIMKHYWNWLIDRVVPLWIAPNVLTLFGLLCVVSGYLLIHFHCASFGTPCNAPTWVYLALAGFIFAYQTFDNLDGKQARKTGSSSALGEVFDHGTDSICLPLLSITLGYVFQLGPWITYWSLVMMMTTFILAHWEGYFIHKLVLRPIANPTEVQLITISTLLITAYQGPFFWLDTVSLPVFGLVQLRYLVLAGSIWGAVSTCYELWAPSDPYSSSDCMLGRKTYYTRRKRSVNCFNPQEYETIVNSTNCPCTKEDYECDYCFEPNSSGDCVQVCEPEVECNQDGYYMKTQGYRFVPGDTCNVKEGLNLMPIKTKCSSGGSGGSSANVAGIVVAIVFVVLAAGGAIGFMLYVYKYHQPEWVYERIFANRSEGNDYSTLAVDAMDEEPSTMFDESLLTSTQIDEH